MPDPTPAPAPGATYKFVVRTADEAVQTIRERLGPNARVLSVRQVGGQGLRALFSRPKLEVVAQVGGEEESAPASPPPETRSGLPLTQPEEKASVETPAAPASLAQLYASRATSKVDQLPRLPELLRRSGFSETLLSRLEGTPAFAKAADVPLHRALADVGQQLRKQAAARPVRPLPNRVAFLGTPGVGRTTALCKWLAREVFAYQRRGRVLKAEFDRPNAAEGLAVFCEALGIPIEYYSAAEDGGPSTLTADGGFLYADLPGLSLRSPGENAPIAAFLDRENFAGRVLVMNAAYDTTMLRRAYAAGSDLGATHVVFTHLDELEHWGKLWDFLLDGAMTPLFLATGPSLTGDCDDDPLGAVLRKTVPGA